LTCRAKSAKLEGMMRESVGVVSKGAERSYLFRTGGGGTQLVRTSPSEVSFRGFFPIPVEVSASVAVVDKLLTEGCEGRDFYLPAKETAKHFFIHPEAFSRTVEETLNLSPAQMRVQSCIHGLFKSDYPHCRKGLVDATKRIDSKLNWPKHAIAVVKDVYYDLKHKLYSGWKLYASSLPISALRSLLRVYEDGRLTEVDLSSLREVAKVGPKDKGYEALFVHLKSGLSISKEPDLSILLVPGDNNVVIDNRSFVQILRDVLDWQGRPPAWGYVKRGKYYLFDGKNFLTVSPEEATAAYAVSLLPRSATLKLEPKRAFLEKLIGKEIPPDFLPAVWAYYLLGGDKDVRLHSVSNGRRAFRRKAARNQA